MLSVKNKTACRYSCFPCDLDMCSDCAGKEAKLLDRQRRKSCVSTESRWVQAGQMTRCHMANLCLFTVLFEPKNDLCC